MLHIQLLRYQKRTNDNPEKLATVGTQDEDKQNTIHVRHHYAQTNTKNVNKTRALLQTTGGKRGNH